MPQRKNPAPGLSGDGAAFGMRGSAECGLIQLRNQAPTAQRRMRLISFKPLVKGALRGFVNVELPNELTVTDCPVCTSGGKVWASLPSKPVLDRDGKHVEINGKRQYCAILSWADRQTADRWSEAVVALLREAHPDALEAAQ